MILAKWSSQTIEYVHSDLQFGEQFGLCNAFFAVLEIDGESPVVRSGDQIGFVHWIRAIIRREPTDPCHQIIHIATGAAFAVLTGRTGHLLQFVYDAGLKRFLCRITFGQLLRTTLAVELNVLLEALPSDGQAHVTIAGFLERKGQFVLLTEFI